MSTPESNLWWTRVKIDLYQKKLLRWVIDTGSGSGAGSGEIILDEETDLEGYLTWKETYLSVEASLHLCLGGMLPVVLADLRYLGLGEECRILERVRVIREIYADYDLTGVFDDEDDVDGVTAGTEAETNNDSLAPTQTSPAKRPLADPYPSPISKRPNPAPSSLHQPSQTKFDRVYRSPTKISQDTRRLRCKAVMELDPWGQRCSICGLPNGEGSNAHRTYACTSTTYATTNRENVLVKMSRKPDALVVQYGPHMGRKVCYEWNTRRTRDGRCYIKDCQLHHSCSLCLDDSHRAWDCEAREYLPELGPRPRSMVPANVEDCWRLYSANAM